jgi:hypothetical protein
LIDIVVSPALTVTFGHCHEKSGGKTVFKVLVTKRAFQYLRLDASGNGYCCMIYVNRGLITCLAINNQRICTEKCKPVRCIT